MWVYASDRMLARYFEGANVFTFERRSIGITTVQDPAYENELTAGIFEVEINGKRKKFATTEVSNGIHAYYLPAAQCT